MSGLDRDGDVFILDLGDDENRLNPASVAAINRALDEAEAAPKPKALVTTASGKFWCNGFDLAWMTANPGGIDPFIQSVRVLFARFVTLPMPTVAAVGGHAFGAGAVLALSHDQQVMRVDRGYFCLPEVDIDIPFSGGITDLIRSRMPTRTAHEAMTTGRRYGGDDALAAGIIDGVADQEKVLPTAIGMARPLTGKASPTLGTIKARLYASAVAGLVANQAVEIPI
ncbi:enoyl-CoA hydratase/carnithine racemase [Frankia sp. EI5c]|uniref:enoyl-CoA hydratase-related protein n=1 Tax=Frankia sp. EI5c TaxID=683316 RepID=UPI0007C347C4|nr:enoyl-CoA hydratase-related protein [Frankia sp. EI5c]OAA27138.1 enoyl-CoA hydratase/carnithine racemase [Frankia sp. EI5c]